MRPKVVGAAVVLAVLAVLAWPVDSDPLESSSTDGGGPKEATPANASPLIAIGLACASLALFLQGFRPRSEAVARALSGEERP